MFIQVPKAQFQSVFIHCDMQNRRKVTNALGGQDCVQTQLIQDSTCKHRYKYLGIWSVSTVILG